MWPFSHVASLSRTNFLSCNFFSPFHGCPSCSYPLGSSSEAVFLGILCLSQLHWGFLSWPSPLCPRGRHYSCLSADCKSLHVTEASCLPSGVSIKEFPPPNFKNTSHHLSESGSNSTCLLDLSSLLDSHWSVLLLGLLMDSLQIVPPKLILCSLLLDSNHIMNVRNAFLALIIASVYRAIVMCGVCADFPGVPSCVLSSQCPGG